MNRDTQIKTVDHSRLEESISVVEHCPEWGTWFRNEVLGLRRIFGATVVAFEHVGSSVIPRLLSKPIVDILVGLQKFELEKAAVDRLEERGYEFFGQLHANQQRMFARKRGDQNFNLQIVPHASGEWVEKIAFRDYLLNRPDAVERYCVAKREAIEAGNNTLLAYHRHKDSVVTALLQEAMQWHANRW